MHAPFLLRNGKNQMDEYQREEKNPTSMFFNQYYYESKRA
jgi:hypothetical protein